MRKRCKYRRLNHGYLRVAACSAILDVVNMPKCRCLKAVEIVLAKKSDTYHHGNLRQAMLFAAAEVLAEKGLQGLTLRACARQAGVSHAAPAHHFAGLKGLLTAIAAESFVMIAVVAEKIYAQFDGNPEALLKTFAVSYSQFAKENPERFRLMFRRDLLDTDDQDLCAAEARAYSTFVKIVHGLRGEQAATLEDFRQGHLSKPMYVDVALYWSAVHGFAHLNIENQLVGYDQIVGVHDLENDMWTAISKRMLGTPSAD